MNGFSQLSKSEKINRLAQSHPLLDLPNLLQATELKDSQLQSQIEKFSENTIGHFPLPFGIAPHFLINGQSYQVPMVTEESSVVAAASRGAKFWSTRGGIQAQVLGTEKKGQIHFLYSGDIQDLSDLLPNFKTEILDQLTLATASMEKRGGGIVDLSLKEPTQEQRTELKDYYQLELTVQTCDAMGANFINTLLEEIAQAWKEYCDCTLKKQSITIIMSILTNYTPHCLVQASVQCQIDQLGRQDGLSAQQFAFKFFKAVQIAHYSVERAVTHNKGIFNGIDAVVMATGNDFRAVEACGHAYAARTGQYRSLSHCHLENDQFHFSLMLPMNIGTVGGLTQLHPLAAASLEILANPSAPQLMQIIAAVGLIQNFSAIRSLVTTGIQKGHMKMHLENILTQLKASAAQKEQAKKYFSDKVISYHQVKEFLAYH